MTDTIDSVDRALVRVRSHMLEADVLDDEVEVARCRARLNELLEIRHGLPQQPCGHPY